MGEQVDLDKLRSITPLRHKGTVKEVVKDERGSKEIHHEDGRIDATISPESIQLKVSPKGT